MNLQEFLEEYIRRFKPPYSYSEVEEILEKYHNKVLSEVQSEVEKHKQEVTQNPLQTRNGKVELWNGGYNNALINVSTIINNLKVKTN